MSLILCGKYAKVCEALKAIASEYKTVSGFTKATARMSAESRKSYVDGLILDNREI